MSASTTIILTVLALVVMCSALPAASRRPDAAWNYYHFDGRSFAAGPSSDGGAFLAVRNRCRPVVLTRMANIEASELPAGKGTLAGICYIQSSGGKLAGNSGYLPCPGVSVTISSGSGVVMIVQTDASGFFVAVLDAGSYTAGNGAFSSRFTVEKGTTVLVPLRAGKRMVD